MKDLLFWGALAATSVLGYYIMSKIDILEEKLRQDHRPYRWRHFQIQAPTLTPLPSILSVLKSMRNAYPPPRPAPPRPQRKPGISPFDREEPEFPAPPQSHKED